MDKSNLCCRGKVLLSEKRLERYISIAWDSGAMPVVVMTKSDLCDDLENKLSEVSSVAFGVEVLVTTSTEENGYWA